jgi:ribosomal-protein-alanine N-acetyltransferase
VILRTQRLRLRPLVRDDLDSLATLLGDPEVMRFSLGLLDREQAGEKLDRILATCAARGWNSFAVEWIQDDRFAGICGLAPQNVDDIEEIELGYRLMPDSWGQGVATEAARACRDYAFNAVGLPRIISIIEAANVGSIRVAEKIGLHLEKEMWMWERPVRIYSKSNVTP